MKTYTLSLNSKIYIRVTFPPKQLVLVSGYRHSAYCSGWRQTVWSCSVRLVLAAALSPYKVMWRSSSSLVSMANGSERELEGGSLDYSGFAASARHPGSITKCRIDSLRADTGCDVNMERRRERTASSWNWRLSWQLNINHNPALDERECCHHKD